MLLALATLVWYGPAAASMTDTAAATVVASVKGYARPAAAVSGLGLMTNADATRLVNSPMSATGLGVITAATPKGRARPAVHVKIGELSQDDVSGAVMEYPVEGDLTLKQAIRLLLAVAAGNATQLTTNPIFKSMDGSIVRIAGTITGGTRTITTRDGA